MHRSQNDPKIHDDSASSRVFQELAPSQAHKTKSCGDLELELFGGIDSAKLSATVRENEGEAAEYGVFFDDTDYDYMQHMRDLNGGTGDGESFFVDAPAKKKDGKGKAKVNLEDALREASLDDKTTTKKTTNLVKGLLDDDILYSKSPKKVTYQDQQDVPDVLAGFQPNMDPRLREVLEALEDEAYVDHDGNEDFFGQLAKDREEISLAEFEESEYEEDESRGEDDGWETDDTAKPKNEYKKETVSQAFNGEDILMGEAPDARGEDWMKEFGKFKKAERSKKGGMQPANPDDQSSNMTGTSMAGSHRKKRKGAMTSSTGYSMTSSSLFRTEGLTLLDARFDKIEEDYAEEDLDDDDGGASITTGTSINSSRAPLLRSDFDGIMDEFLGGYSMNGRKRIKKGGYQTGIEQLDEIRKGLGPARLKAATAL